MFWNGARASAFAIGALLSGMQSAGATSWYPGGSSDFAPVHVVLSNPPSGYQGYEFIFTYSGSTPFSMTETAYFTGSATPPIPTSTSTAAELVWDTTPAVNVPYGGTQVSQTLNFLNSGTYYLYISLLAPGWVNVILVPSSSGPGSITVTPVPGALALFGTVLFGVIVLMRRRNGGRTPHPGQAAQF
jgi:hypothetical protein